MVGFARGLLRLRAKGDPGHGNSKWPLVCSTRTRFQNEWTRRSSRRLASFFQNAETRRMDTTDALSTQLVAFRAFSALARVASFSQIRRARRLNTTDALRASRRLTPKTFNLNHLSIHGFVFSNRRRSTAVDTGRATGSILELGVFSLHLAKTCFI